MYNLLIIVIYLAFISLGLPDSLLGASWPIMHLDIGIDLSAMGIISMIISSGTVVSSLLSEKLTRRFSTRTVTTVSVFLTALALLGFSYSTNIWMIIIFAIPYGLGAGAIDAALNNYVAIHYSSKHMSWLHCFWGVGTIVSPFIMSYSLSNSNWNSGYRTVAYIQISIAFILLLSKPLWKRQEGSVTYDSQSDTKGIGIVGALKISGVIPLLIGFFAYCAAEGTVMSWACTYLVEHKQLSEIDAAAFASLFFIGMTIGRFLAGFIMDKLGDWKMILLGTILSSIGMLLMIIPTKESALALIGLITIGLGFAPIYPCIIHSTPNNFGDENSGSIIGIQMASAYMGFTFIPPLFGIIAKLTGFVIFPFYIILFTFLMIIMLKKTFTQTANK